MKITHVVRRYGPVGGMERYVWETTQAMRDMGYEIEVICEACLAERPEGIRVHELGSVMPRPRWLALLRFGHRVQKWLAQNPDPDRLVHSHERLGCHHVTTFHGPPFATIFEKHWLRLLSLRVWMQLFLEVRELAVADSIVPVSPVVADQIAHYYPWLAYKLTRPILPGVAPGPVRSARAVPPAGGVIGFVGKEWQRKGLPLAAACVQALRRRRPDAELVVVGPRPEEVRHLFEGWAGGYRIVPWSEQVAYTEFDVLLHPARAEPFGMVITEAMSARVPVLVSDACGAARQIVAAAGGVLPLSSSAERWALALEWQLSRTNPVPRYERDWARVVREYEQIYGEPRSEERWGLTLQPDPVDHVTL